MKSTKGGDMLKQLCKQLLLTVASGDDLDY